MQLLVADMSSSTNTSTNTSTTKEACIGIEEEQNEKDSDNTNSNNNTINDDNATNNTNCCYKRAARALHEADYLLILAGAGMSADSGLTTYETMPETYRKLCDPAGLLLQPQLSTVDKDIDQTVVTNNAFQQFWYDFAVQYAHTQPHRGYDILDRWCHGGKLKRLSRKTRNLQKQRHDHNPAPVVGIDAGIAGANTDAATMAPCNKWWVYTSNVDGHFHRYPSFRRGQEVDNNSNDDCDNNTDDNDNDNDNDNGNDNDNNVCEIHGTTGIFRCSCGIGYVDVDDGIDVDIGGNNCNNNNENFNENDNGNASEQRQPQRVPRMGDIWNRWNESVEEFQTDRCHSQTETLKELRQRMTRTQRPRTVHDNLNNDDNNDEASSMLLCRHCKALPLRPNVLLFNDTDPNVLGGRSSYHNHQHQDQNERQNQIHLHIHHQRARYQDWEAAVEEAVVHHQQRLVLVEIGCGKNVPAVRQESQDVLEDVLELLLRRQQQHCKTTRSRGGGSGNGDYDGGNGDGDSSASVTLIRINPKDAGIDGDDDENDTNNCNGNGNGETTKSCVVSIFDTSLRALERIDRELDALVDSL